MERRVCHACSGWGHVAYPPAKNLVCPVTLLVDYCYYNSTDKEEFNKLLGKPAKVIVRKPTVDEKTWVSTFFPDAVDEHMSENSDGVPGINEMPEQEMEQRLEQ